VRQRLPAGARNGHAALRGQQVGVLIRPLTRADVHGEAVRDATMRKTAFSSVWVAAAILCSAVAAEAQNYRFRVPEVKCDVLIEKDSSLRIRYEFTFDCAPGAHPIDIVDVGMPAKNYEVVSASADGVPLHSWRPSTQIAIGPEIHLGGQAIPGGERGVVKVEATVGPGLIWQDTTDSQYASFRFTPTWFGSKYVVGNTKLTLSYIFPDGADLKAVRWQKDPEHYDVQGYRDDVGGRPFVAWLRTVSFTSEHMFGVSFPRTNVTNVRHVSIWMLIGWWWEGSPQVRLYSGILYGVIFVFLFLLSFGL
jgi:hypothetical protein